MNRFQNQVDKFTLWNKWTNSNEGRLVLQEVIPPMNWFIVEPNNTSPFQQGTPTKLAFPIKEKPKLKGGICSWCVQQSNFTSKIEPTDS